MPKDSPSPNRRSSDIVTRSMCRRRTRFDIDTTRAQSGLLKFWSIPEGYIYGHVATWSYSPEGILRNSPNERQIGDIHFSYLSGTIDATFYVCVHRGQSSKRWVEVHRGFQHPLYPTHVLHQQGKSAPRWVLLRTFETYIRARSRLSHS